MLDQRLDQPVEVTSKQAGKVVDGDSDAVVRHPVVRKVVCPDLLGSLAAPHLRSPLLASLLGLRLTLHVEQPGPQDRERLGLVLVLALLVLDVDHKAGGKVGHAHS